MDACRGARNALQRDENRDSESRGQNRDDEQDAVVSRDERILALMGFVYTELFDFHEWSGDERRRILDRIRGIYDSGRGVT